MKLKKKAAAVDAKGTKMPGMEIQGISSSEMRKMWGFTINPDGCINFIKHPRNGSIKVLEKTKELYARINGMWYPVSEEDALKINQYATKEAIDLEGFMTSLSVRFSKEEVLRSLSAILKERMENENYFVSERSAGYLAKRSHSDNCCCGWKIYQPDGTTTRSFKDALDGSYLQLAFVYGPFDGPMISETWENEYFIKCNGKWFEIDSETYYDVC